MTFENVIILNLFLSYLNIFCITESEGNESNSYLQQGRQYLFFLLVSQSNSLPCPLVELPGKTVFLVMCQYSLRDTVQIRNIPHHFHMGPFAAPGHTKHLKVLLGQSLDLNSFSSL